MASVSTAKAAWMAVVTRGLGLETRAAVSSTLPVTNTTANAAIPATAATISSHSSVVKPSSPRRQQPPPGPAAVLTVGITSQL